MLITCDTDNKNVGHSRKMMARLRKDNRDDLILCKEFSRNDFEVERLYRNFSFFYSTLSNFREKPQGREVFKSLFEVPEW